MIDRVYQTVKMLANSDVRGNMKPADFDKALYNVMTEKFEEYPFELTKYLNRQNRGLVGDGVENLPDIIREKLEHFLTSGLLTYANGKFTIPANFHYLDSIIYNGLSELSICKNISEFNQLRRFRHTQPSIDFPIGFKINNTIEVLPAAIIDKVTAYYLRKPLVPKWTYLVIEDVEVFNPDALDFQDIDMHASEEDDIVSRLCVKFGINLKEQDLQMAGNNDEMQEDNKKNAN